MQSNLYEMYYSDLCGTEVPRYLLILVIIYIAAGQTAAPGAVSAIQDSTRCFGPPQLENRARYSPPACFSNPRRTTGTWVPSQNVELEGSKTERLRGHSLSCEIQRAAAARAAPRFDARRCRDAPHAMIMTCPCHASKTETRGDQY